MPVDHQHFDRFVDRDVFLAQVHYRIFGSASYTGVGIYYGHFRVSDIRRSREIGNFSVVEPNFTFQTSGLQRLDLLGFADEAAHFLRRHP